MSPIATHSILVLVISPAEANYHGVCHLIIDMLAPIGPVLLVDDDQLFYQAVLCEVAPHHQLVVLTNVQAAITYLEQAPVAPFLIICASNLRSMTGLPLRAHIDTDRSLRKLAIPFVFITHPVYEQPVEKAYELTIQGLLEKQPDVASTRQQLQSVIAYWSAYLHPNRFSDEG